MPALFVDNLTVIDCSYLHPQRGLLGESWIVDIELHGELDDQGMVFDFGHVKKAIKNAIDECVDHKLVCAKGDAGLRVNSAGTQTELSYDYQRQGRPQQLWHSSPSDALCLLDAEVVTTDTVSAYLQTALMAVVPQNVSQIKIRLRHEGISGAYYHYSHGLKKHLGNCQRIAHGHRSAIEISVDGTRSQALEEQWAQRWRDIYIGSAEDVISRENEHYHFAYSSQQGRFELKIPQNNCDIINVDSTVEHIASHIQNTLMVQQLGEVQVKAFEGVLKGAIA